jgi:TetR/AcrR family transcriptional regulator, transcriptional repressor for nem operon
MPYPADHGAKTRKRIMNSARGLFDRHGFESVMLQQFMVGVGLTHGTFYSCFKSKSDLYVEAPSCLFTGSHWKHSWEGVGMDMSATDGARKWYEPV